MKLQPQTESKLDAWLAPSTWHTNHDNDMNRWYEFVNQYQRDHGFQVPESDLKELIVRKAEIENNDALKETVSERISLAYNILDFLKHTGR